MTPEIRAVLTAHQQQIAKRVIAEEETRRPHLVVSLSGAHAYGFPSPDSDLDVKAVHLDPTAELLGFPRPSRSAERLEVIEGVEVDYSSNELGNVLASVLKGNGNFIERFLSGYVMAAGGGFEELKALVRASLSKRLYRHYLGFGTQQRQEWQKTEGASAKKLLYVLRTTLTGTHALLEREIITDVTQLLGRYGFGDAIELVEQKRAGEKVELSSALRLKWADRIPRTFEELDRAYASSPLPEEPPNAEAIEAWLIRTRLSHLPGP